MRSSKLPSMQRFSYSNAHSLEAVGRVNSGGTKPTLALSIGTEGVLRCVGSNGFSISIQVAELLNRYPNRSNVAIHPSLVVCTLDDGSTIECMGRISPRDGRLRLDAVDQDNFYWFWFEVRPRAGR